MSQAEQSDVRIEAPLDLREALRANARAQAAWDEIPATHQREYVDFIAEAQQPETRARRVTNSVEMLVAWSLARATRTPAKANG